MEMSSSEKKHIMEKSSISSSFSSSPRDESEWGAVPKVRKDWLKSNHSVKDLVETAERLNHVLKPTGQAEKIEPKSILSSIIEGTPGLLIAVILNLFLASR